MENASKALIIAGAILISILLISIGIMIFTSSSGLFNSAKTSMSDQEKNMFNQKFTMYEGSKATASEVRELIRAVINNNADAENPDIQINGTDIDNSTSTTAIPSDGTALVNAKQYTIQCTLNQGVVSNITISETP